MMPIDMMIQLSVSVVTLMSLVGGFALTVYNSNKNRILGDERRRAENVALKQAVTDLSEEVTATNKRLEDKIDRVAEKVEEHSHFEPRIARLEGRMDAFETRCDMHFQK